ncbi:MAG: prepilin-type N-terminal cleavage/methylation domain-containing protein [Rhodocyclaceae bacterium]
MNRVDQVRGFSLIEVMIVIVIIGVAAATVSLSIPSDAAQALRHDAEDLAQRLTAAQHEVRVDGRLIAWQARGDGYYFARGTWTRMAGSVVPQLTTAGALDEFDGDDVLGPRRWRARPVSVQPAQPIVLTSEWMGPPVELTLRSGDRVATIVRDAAGGFRVR